MIPNITGLLTCPAITGSTVGRGGGGGGGNYGSSAGGASDGGGNGGTTGAGSAGTANTGGGGGANRANTGGGATGQIGGTGVVILRVLTSVYTGTTSGSPTVTTDGDSKVLVFTGTGSYTA